MARVALNKAVTLSAHQAFDIASDVSSYKEFLPLVTRSTIRGIIKEQGDVKSFDADLMVAYVKLGLREGFTSHVECNQSAGTVTATSNDGPMRALKAVWQITAIDGSRSTVAIVIDYEFKSKLMQLASGSLMPRAVAKVLEAFEERGRKLYPESALLSI